MHRRITVTSVSQIHAPEDFLTALDSLRGHEFRPELHIVQIPPPKRIAPWAVALQAEINDSTAMEPDNYRGGARFVVLHDPAGQEAWHGTFRIVCHMGAPMDAAMAGDPLLGEVAWAWLADTLDAHGADYHHLVGTVTRMYNETFGGLELSSSLTEVELRASWTPNSPDLYHHVRAWADFIALACGLAPEGTTALPAR